MQIPENPSSDRMTPPSADNSNQLFISLIVGLFLLLPLLAIVWGAQVTPAFDTLNLSQSSFNGLGNPKYVGMQNFDKLFQDSGFSGAIPYTLLILAARFVVVAIIPALVGMAVGAQGFRGRIVNRLLLSVIAVLVSPVAITVLWGALWGQLWGRQPSPLFPPPDWLFLASPTGARISTIVLDMLMTGVTAAVVGGTAYIAVMRGRSISPSAPLAGLGVWLMGALLVAIGVVEPFALPYVLTGGGPGRATTSLGLNLYINAFRNLQLGYGAAQSVILVLVPMLLVVLLWAVMFAFRLRLRYAPEPDSSTMGIILTPVSLLLILLIGLPLIILALWGVWVTVTGTGSISLNSFTQMLNGTSINWGQSLANTVLVPWAAVWLVQIPITWMAGLSLGFVRPLGWVFSNLLFLPFLLVSFIPPQILSIAWFNEMHQYKLLNSLPALAVPWLVSGIALVVFKLFFDGAHERYTEARQQGQTAADAFISTVFLPSIPIVLVVGVLSSFVSAQELWWSLLVSNDQSLWSVPMQLVALRGGLAAPGTTVLPAAAVFFIAVLGIAFIPMILLLQVFVLDRLAIIAGRSALRGVPLKPQTGTTPGMMDTPQIGT